MGTSKQAVGDRVSTISQLGCSTSMALATGPTEEDGTILTTYFNKHELMRSLMMV